MNKKFKNLNNPMNAINSMNSSNRMNCSTAGQQFFASNLKRPAYRDPFGESRSGPPTSNQGGPNKPNKLSNRSAGESEKRSIFGLMKAQTVRGFTVITAALHHCSTAAPFSPNKSNKLLFWVSCVALLLISIPSTALADLGDLFTYFQPYISADEEFNSNINLTPNNLKQSDYITTISPGFRFSTLPRAATTGEREAPTAEQRFGTDLDLRAGFVFYGKEENNNYTSLSGSLNAWYLLTQKLAFRVRDYLIRSDEIREQDYSTTAVPGQNLLSRTFVRAIYYRNVVEPSFEYRFGRENIIGINYRNNIYEIDSRVSEDSQENYINPRLAYWFNIRNGVSFEYGLTLADFERSSDLVGHTAAGRYTYRFNPRTSIFGEYVYLMRDFESPSTDYVVHRPSLGFEHAFSPTLSGRAQVGYFWQNPDRGSGEDGFSYDVALTQRAQKTTYTIALQGGYTEDYFTSENLGFTLYYRGIGAVTHQLLEKMTAGFFGSYEWAKYPERLVGGNRQEDNIWAIGGDASYQPFRWLMMSIVVAHRENHSNIDTFDYSEYRGIFRVTASF
jgi:hypothetical protein